MNILREVRKVNQRSMPIRILLLLTFCVIFTVTTYAWFSTAGKVNLGGLQADVTSWDVSYYVGDNEILDETVTFTIDSLYPGMPFREEFLHIYNIGEANTKIDCELVSVKLFGNEILAKDDEGNLFLEEHKKDENGQDIVEQKATITKVGNTTTVFAGDTVYPFNISYTYDNYLEGEYDENDPVTSESAHGLFCFNANWTYKAEDSEDIAARDEADTRFGRQAYDYYVNRGGDPSKAIEIQVKIKSTRADFENE